MRPGRRGKVKEMSVSLEQVKGMKKDDQIVVKNTSEVWIVLSVKIDPAGKQSAIEATNGRVTGMFPQDRWGLIDQLAYEAAPPYSPLDPQKMADDLRPGMNAAFKEIQAETNKQAEAAKTAEYSEVTDETGIEMRIEKQFVEEPELTKPAKKSPRKKK
jgi:hypothetical protein